MQTEIQKNELTVIGMKQGALVRRGQEMDSINTRMGSEKDGFSKEIDHINIKISELKREINNNIDLITDYEQKKTKKLALKEKQKDDYGKLR